VVAHRH